MGVPESPWAQTKANLTGALECVAPGSSLCTPVGVTELSGSAPGMSVRHPRDTAALPLSNRGAFWGSLKIKLSYEKVEEDTWLLGAQGAG